MGKIHIKKITFILAAVILTVSSVPSISVTAASRAQQVGEQIVVVIDAGHGGTDKGAEVTGLPTEKEMTLVSALAMEEELLKYHNLSVYLTRREDRDMSAQRGRPLPRAWERIL